MKKTLYTQTEGGKGFYALLAGFGVIILAGMLGVLYMEHNGHWVTGMNNQIVWGMPHVFAIFLIVAASGALNVASIGSVFGKKMYKPLAPLSGLLAIALLLGGLTILVLDLGRPDRLIVAMTEYNFKSIFAWNIYLYTGFFVIVGAYLWTMLYRPANKYGKGVGTFAFVWRLALTTGTGSIFGFLVARQGYDAALMAPMFITFSFAYGLAIKILLLHGHSTLNGMEIGNYIEKRLKNLLGIFVAASAYFTAVYHLTNLYGTENHGYEAFILLNGGIYTTLFWVGQVGIGYVLPLILLLLPNMGGSQKFNILAGSVLIILGGMAQMYVTIIGGQAFPLQMFPGMEVTSSFADGIVGAYSPSLPEFLLGIMGFALALVIVLVLARVFRIMPATLADRVMDPHFSEPEPVQDDEADEFNDDADDADAANPATA